MRSLLRLALAVLVLAGPTFAADPGEALCECAKTAVACGGAESECTCAKVPEGTQCPVHRGKAKSGEKQAAPTPPPAKADRAPKPGASK